MKPGQLAKTIGPFIVSISILVWLLIFQIDARAVLSRLDARAAGVLLPALLAFGALSLWLEVLSLVRLIPQHKSFDRLTAARVKAASYLLSVVHYAAGAGSVALLLRRRAGMSLSDAAGVVLLIVFFDLTTLIALTAVGVAFVETGEPVLRAGVILGAAIAVAGGFALLRAPGSLGPLDRLRSLELFRAARTSTLRQLTALALLRLCFVVSFIALGHASLVAFGVDVPLGDLVVGFTVVSLVGALPIAVSGLGTGQVAFVYVFRHWADPETLLACSLSMSAGLILMRAALGIFFAREFTREAIAAAREGET